MTLGRQEKSSATAKGERIRQLREQQSHKQESLVAAANRSFSIETLRRAERGQRISAEKLAAIARSLEVDVSEISEKGGNVRPIEVFHAEIPNSLFGLYLAKVFGADAEYDRINFQESTGDIDPDRSSIVLKGGIELKFGFEHVDQAKELILREKFQPMSEAGFRVTSWVVQGFKERWGKEEGIPHDVKIICLFEKGAPNFDELDSDLLSDALIRYAFDVPDDCDRGFLNSIPSPSITKSIFIELINREEWGEIKSIFFNLGGFRDGFIVQWAAEIIRSESGISNEEIKLLVNDALSKHDAIIPQTKHFLETWFGE